MKTKKLTPRNVAPVKRVSVAAVSTDADGIAPCYRQGDAPFSEHFAGDDTE